MIENGEALEWLEPDGLGGFASGTVSGIRTRRYHALLLSSARPPTERFVLVNGVDVHVELDGRTVPLSAQAYAPWVTHPGGHENIASFGRNPWPTWRYSIGGGLTLEHELFVVNGAPVTAMSWSLPTKRKATLVVRPFLSGRDYHSLHHENPNFRFASEVEGSRVVWRPYPGVPAIEAHHGGSYDASPDWYRRFRYAEETARGLDDTEDLATPGIFRFDLSKGSALLVFTARPGGNAEGDLESTDSRGTVRERFRRLRAAEKKRRAALGTPDEVAADAYLVRRGAGKTIVAGYPWFTDWGRDTFIAMRGLCLTTGRFAEAREILLQWSEAVSEGMLPNRFPDSGEAPEYNSVDASLWYVVAVAELLAQGEGREEARMPRAAQATLERAVTAILEGYSKGTRYGIAMDSDGLLKAGVPGQQLTWMDAKVGDWVVTPRIGKPVEIQALWLNALEAGSWVNPRWSEIFDSAHESFGKKFWNAESECLFDVVDVNHERDVHDASIRPNQIFAVGGLPVAILKGDRARKVVDRVEDELWTPLGLRTLSPNDSRYAGRYGGDRWTRDGAYHQGTVWPWLLGAFVDAWLRVRGSEERDIAEARSRFLEPIERHSGVAGLGHVSEIADGDAPHTPRGCPFQAWSVGEFLRIQRMLGAVAPKMAAAKVARVADAARMGTDSRAAR